LISSGTTILNAKQVSKRFGALVVLDQVDFVVREGEAIGIVGPNGAGKTTLMNVLSGTYAASGGTVELMGEDVTATSAAIRCHKGLSKTHQIPRPFLGMTVFENIYVAATHGAALEGEAAYDLTHESLKLCGMTAIANRKAEMIGLLDRKRLELARALATRPKILLLDEIGGGLTDAEASELVETIRELRRRGVSIVWIEHIVHVLLQVAERLICMDAGKIIADGEPAVVMKNKAVVEAYLGRTPE
jgi:branched-chain amino acid transport system ATP-binding protein